MAACPCGSVAICVATKKVVSRAGSRHSLLITAVCCGKSCCVPEQHGSNGGSRRVAQQVALQLLHWVRLVQLGLCILKPNQKKN